MEKKYLCTIRPFDCTYYRHEHLCGDDNSEKVCQYAREAPITADEIEPDAIDREILQRLRRMAVKQSTTAQMDFVFNGEKSEEQLEEIRQEAIFDYVIKNQMKKGEEPEYIGRETGFNTNHEFPEDIRKTLDAIGFEKKEYRYYGTATNSVPQKLQIEFGVDGNMLACKNLTNLKYIFIVDTSIEVGYFIVLLQAFGIIHHRYIYERIRGIRDQFDENHNDNF